MGNSLVRVNGKVYEVLGSLGEGGFAHVYEVRRDGRHFALKWTRRVTEGEDLERLLLEIQVQRRLVHPNVLALTAAEVRRRQSSSAAEAVALYPTARQLQDQSRFAFDGTAEKEVLMLFPIASRGSLQSFLDEAARKHTPAFTEHNCLRFFALLVDAVAALHDLGFAHRDIKPGNILLTSSDPVEPLLMDFGSVAPLHVTASGRLENRTLWEEAARYSSAPYRAPELWDSGTDSAAHVLIDGRTDVWALGCVLYAIAFGRLSPFEHPRDGVQQLAILNGNVSFPPGNMHLGQMFTPTFIALIKWILTPDTAERPTLEGVRRCIDQLCSSTPETTSRRRSDLTTTERRPSTRKHSINSKGRRTSSVTHQVGEEAWADFSAFVKPQSDASELSSSLAVRAWPSSASATTKTARIRNSSATRNLSIKRASSSSLRGQGTTSAVLRASSRGLSDSNRRRALSRTGKQLWMGALDPPMSG